MAENVKDVVEETMEPETGNRPEEGKNENKPEDREKNTQTGFKPIQTQEELDSVIRERIKRAQRAERAKFEGYIKPEDFDQMKQENEDLKMKISDYELLAIKKQVAKEFGIPESLAGRIYGTNEKECRQDAKNLAELVAQRAPHKSNENLDKSSSEYEFLRNLRGR